jgi:lipoprotein-anchoring transpeptidase ErfK/SrfK
MCNVLVRPISFSHKRQNDRDRRQFRRFLLIVAFVFCATACVQKPPENSTVTNASQPPANTDGASNSTASRPPSGESQVPVTLPLVDAMLQDESFANDAKSSLQITDEQIQKLSDAARDDILHLDETDQDTPRSTRAATKKAEQTIKQVLGADKGNQFIAFVRERGAGVNAETTTVPNSVPTDTRIVINSPGYRMDIFENGKLVKTYMVGIGYPEFPLPTGLRKADKIIFNPPWTPPDSPWVKGKFRPGKTVEPGSKDNPLGILKIPIGLPNLIHGGKRPDRLGNFASHGCVGLTNDLVREFALEVAKLSNTPLTLDQMHEYEREKTESKDVKLQSAVPVELRYETIVVQNGKLIIYRDVYEKGTNTEENLRRVLDAAGVSFDSFSQTDQQQMREALQRMAVDAVGNPVDENDTNKESKSSTRETKNVKGLKDITLEFPQLAGRGYPDPVNLAGQVPEKKQDRGSNTSSRRNKTAANRAP